MRLSECSICALVPVDTRRRLTVGDSDVLCVMVEPVHEGVGLSHLGARAFGLWIRLPPGLCLSWRALAACVGQAPLVCVWPANVCAGWGAARPGSMWPPGSSGFGHRASRDHAQFWRALGG